MPYKLIHLSDLHFGTHDDAMADTLLKSVNNISADIVIVSGDFTQIASEKEFRLAKNFIDDINAPVFCVPGNHDIPHYNLWQRFLSPYKRYKKFINSELCPVSRGEEIVICGLNSARRILPHWNWAHGKISKAQMSVVKEHFSYEKRRKLRVFVCHHPLHEAADTPLKTLVWGGKKALKELLDLRTDILLTGHAHHAAVTVLEESGHRLAAISASTALSSRLRSHENGFNIVTIDNDTINVDIMRWSGSHYELLQQHSVVRN